jgi:hypothetical protein
MSLKIMAEASGSRTHRRLGNQPSTGFEDRDDHRTMCASKEDFGKRVAPDCRPAKSSGTCFALRSVQYPEQVPARRVDHEHRVLIGIIISVVADTVAFYSSLYREHTSNNEPGEGVRFVVHPS